MFRQLPVAFQPLPLAFQPLLFFTPRLLFFPLPSFSFFSILQFAQGSFLVRAWVSEQ